MIPIGRMDTVLSVEGLQEIKIRQEHLIVTLMVVQKTERKSQEVILKEKKLDEDSYHEICTSYHELAVFWIIE